uniref:Uncharacterized protein n=1 Tax=Palpitomonas bilix TaxID=652834 RepID=A0A7S3LV69_9EUKA|mmetsp:Transcript_48541/g.125944  ORF Transcript_48541/g.125944 Transcript_48541/m.125944 type:complete len:190 (+) Transcript_48541:158-727(+)
MNFSSLSLSIEEEIERERELTEVYREVRSYILAEVKKVRGVILKEKRERERRERSALTGTASNTHVGVDKNRGGGREGGGQSGVRQGGERERQERKEQVEAVGNRERKRADRGIQGSAIIHISRSKEGARCDTEREEGKGEKGEKCSIKCSQQYTCWCGQKQGRRKGRRGSIRREAGRRARKARKKRTS